MDQEAIDAHLAYRADASEGALCCMVCSVGSSLLVFWLRAVRGPPAARRVAVRTSRFQCGREEKGLGLSVMEELQMKVHIGSVIREEMDRQGRSATWLAKVLCVHRATVYDIYNRQSIDTEQLRKICEALGVNFFLLLGSDMPGCREIVDRTSGVE